MAYYSGQASSYPELLNVLTSACVAEGWTWADGILSKGGIFVKLTISTGDGAGIVATGGTGKAGTALLNASPIEPRLGRHNQSAPIVTFPLNYMLHVFGDTPEVFLMINFDIDRYHYLAFGAQASPEICLWIVATAGKSYSLQYSAGSLDFTISPTVGLEQMLNYSKSTSCGPFWCTRGGVNNDLAKTAVYSAVDAAWLVSADLNVYVNAIDAVQPLIRINQLWNSESILLPIQIVQNRLSNKKSIIGNIKRARYIRIDNYEPGQIITLGSVKWKIYPFYRKNIAQRDGGGTGGADHTGTFGWAIGYDGP